MSHIINVRNVNYAFKEGWWHLRIQGLREASRAGPVLVAPGLMVTEYRHPRERVLFNPRRDANAVFHLVESLWMLAGGNSVQWLKQFNSRIATYAEKDGTIHGAYGHRWRQHFKTDQIMDVIRVLHKDPTSRQAVVQMWDVTAQDLTGPWADRPCNTHVYFDCRQGVLNMTVCCRSNDMLWGAYGANAVHFSILQEVVAHGVGIPMGVYRQMSNNMHVYLDNEQVQHFIANPPFNAGCCYITGAARALPLLQPEEAVGSLLVDCVHLMDPTYTGIYTTAFVRNVARPLATAYLRRQAKLPWSVDSVPDCDWKLAFNQWTTRRDDK